MATLDAFLQDLDDLDDDDDDEEEGHEDGKGEDGHGSAHELGVSGGDHEGDGVTTAPPKRLDRRQLDTLLEEIDADASSEDQALRIAPRTEIDPEYKRIVTCNELCVRIDDEIEALARETRGLYAKRFPELESIVRNAADYARVVLAFGDAEDLTTVDLMGMLEASTVMVVTVTASETAGKPLAPGDLARVQTLSESILQLTAGKAKIIAYVEKSMDVLAPNLSAVVGANVAARLIGDAGGLQQLASMPSARVEVLGRKKRQREGLAARGHIARMGCLLETALVQHSPPDLRDRVARLVAGRCTLAARVDGFRNAGDKVDSSVGDTFREEILGKLAKWQEPNPFKVPKPLPIPEGNSRKRRGGARARKNKQRNELSDLRIQANRMQFGVQEEVFGLDEEGIGTIGALQGSGAMRTRVQKTHVPRAARLKHASGTGGGATTTGGACVLRRARAATTSHHSGTSFSPRAQASPRPWPSPPCRAWSSATPPPACRTRARGRRRTLQRQPRSSRARPSDQAVASNAPERGSAAREPPQAGANPPGPVVGAARGRRLERPS